MLTKTIIIMTLLFSTTAMPIHSSPAAMPVEPIRNTGAILDGQPKYVDVSTAECVAIEKEILVEAKKAEKNIEPIIQDLKIDSRRAEKAVVNKKMTLKSGKTYEQCMREAFEKTYKKVNPDFSSVNRVPPVEIDIDL